MIPYEVLVQLGMLRTDFKSMHAPGLALEPLPEINIIDLVPLHTSCIKLHLLAESNEEFAVLWKKVFGSSIAPSLAAGDVTFGGQREWGQSSDSSTLRHFAMHI